MSWDKTTPAGNESLVRGDDRIRELKEDLEYALEEEHNFPVDNNNPVATHKFPYGGEAEKPLFSATSCRLYFNTARCVIEYENGIDWADIAVCLPTGTRMIFANLSAITGWTRVVIEDKLLKVSGTDTNEGGSWDLTGYVSDNQDMEHKHYSLLLDISEQINAYWIRVTRDSDEVDMIGTKSDGDAFYRHKHIFDSAGYNGGTGHSSSNADQLSTSSILHNHNATFGDWKLKYFVCCVCEKN